MLFDRIDSDLNNFPEDLRTHIYNIDTNKPLNEIFNKLFSFFETIMRQLKCFEPHSVVYCGFTLQDIKEPIFDCLAASFYLYLEEKLLASKDRKDQLELLYTDIKDADSPELSKRISRKKKMSSQKLQNFGKNCDFDYYKSFLKILNTESNAIIRSLELSHFLFANKNIKYTNENISKRFNLSNFKKLSSEVHNFIQDPPIYPYGIPFTPEKFLAIDFENAFHISLFNQICDYVFYIDEHQNEVHIKTEDFLCIAYCFILLPPYWLKKTETSNTIIDKICTYIMTSDFENAFAHVTVIIEAVLQMIHYPLEVGITYLLRKKYEKLSIDETIKCFLQDIKTTYLNIYSGSLDLNQFEANLSLNDLKLNRKHGILVNTLAFISQAIDFDYNEYNMYYVLGDFDVFKSTRDIINNTQITNFKISDKDVNENSKFYSSHLYAYNDRNNKNYKKVFDQLNYNVKKYLLNFPYDTLFADRIKYFYNENFHSES